MNQEHKNKISKALKGRTLSEQHKEAISNGLKGRKRTKAERQAISEGHKKLKATCPHCGKEGGARVMKRHHFDRCPHNPENQPKKSKCGCGYCSGEVVAGETYQTENGFFFQVTQEEIEVMRALHASPAFRRERPSISVQEALNALH